MTRRLVIAQLLIAAFVLVVVEVPLGLTYTGRAEDRLLADVERDARVLATLVEERVEAGDVEGVQRIAAEYAKQAKGRVVVTDDTGVSVVDTSAAGGAARDFSTRPEVKKALSGSQATGIRSSSTLGQEMAYATVPVSTQGRVIGVIRLSFPTTAMREQVRTSRLWLAALSVLVLAAVAAIGWLIARWVLHPVDELEEGARRLADGDLSGRASVHRGPPELRRLADTFNEMAARVESLVRSQQVFVADASHQLRTPLTVLRLRIESLDDAVTDGSPDPEEIHRDVEVVIDELDRLTRIVEGLLALSRAEGVAQVETVDVAESARSAVQRWDALAEERGVALRATTPEGADARCLAGGIDQILDNLIDNAIEVAPAGSIIDVVVDHRTDDVSLEVRDRGPGMSATERDRATDRFWRAPGAATGGTGLGLAVVDELVKASGGSVALREPEVGPGLVVEASFPAG